MGETFESISGIFINFLEAAEEIIEGLFEEYLEKKNEGELEIPGKIIKITLEEIYVGSFTKRF